MGIYDFSAVGPIGVLAFTVGDINGPNHVELKDSNVLRRVDGTSFATPDVGGLTCL